MEDRNTLEIKKEKLENAIKQQFGNNKNFSIIDNEDGSFLVNMNDTRRMYYINEIGKIIEQSRMLSISTADELKKFRDNVNSGNTYEGWYVYLANDINLDINEQWVPIGLYPMETPLPSDATNTPFQGTFDGAGYKVNGIYIDTEDKAQGLFGLINNGKIMNINIGENCNITGGSATSGVVGYAYNNSIIINCTNAANIDVNWGAGIVGCANTNIIIKHCFNTGIITGKVSNTAGIVGYVANIGTIENCYNTGKIIGKNYVGGIVGFNEISTIENCYNTGNITGECYVGGICGTGSKNSLINLCYNIGDVNALGQNESENSNIGGIVGFNENNVTNCYNTGAISSVYNNVGGIIGLNRGILENSYNIGKISGSKENIGGIVGNNNEFYWSENNTTYSGKIYNSYSLEETAENIYGINNSIIGDECSFKTSTELKNLYLILGKSFKKDENVINKGYPILNWQ